MMIESLFASLFSQENANSKDQQGRDALVDITSATSVVALGPSLITFATTLTETRHKQFHICRIQIHLYLWKFSRDEGPFPKR